MDTRCTAAHSTMDTHCTAHNLKEIPAEKNTEFCKFLRAMPKPYNITDGDFVVGNITECSQYLGVWNDISGRL